MQTNKCQIKGDNHVHQSTMLVLTQPRTLSAFFCCQGTQLAHVPCLPRSPGSFQQNCCQPVSAQTVLLQKVIPPQMQTLHFIMFLLAHFSAYLSPSEWWPCLRVYQLSPIHLVPPTNLMSTHSTTSSRSLIKTLNRASPVVVHWLLVSSGPPPLHCHPLSSITQPDGYVHTVIQ